jgi:hypothetical protein
VTARPRGGSKSHDVGNGILCASFGAGGAWLSLGTTHRQYGFVELSALPAFDEAWRRRPELVRRYRAWMADDRHAFLVVEQHASRSTDEGHGVTHRCAARAPAGGRSIVQRHHLAHAEGQPPPVIRLRFRGRLARPALAMITETGAPPSHSSAANVLEADGTKLTLHAAGLDATAEIDVDGAGDAAWQLEDGAAVLLLRWPARQTVFGFRVTCALWPARGGDIGADAGGRRRPRDARPRGGIPAASLVVPTSLHGAVQRVRRQAVRYVTGCTALSVAPARVVILTDHRILPLSWTRDAYYQALLLLSEGRAELVADHLRWLWLSCDRPTGAWARSHHADGRRKDDVYQADQQLYPLLELSDYWRLTGRLPALDRLRRDDPTWTSLVSQVLDSLAGSLSVEGLLATDENAADDPAIHPYLVSVQILAWHAFKRLAEMKEVLRITHPVAEMAERSRRSVRDLFPIDGPAGPLWAYALDGQGESLLHHDANDLPTAFAPLWGFCAADDPVWRRTMDFAFSPANDGYVSGRFGGLGSRHTPGTWSLGLIQEWVACSLAGEVEAATDALRRLVAVALSDGSLPEASDPDTGAVVARHWFAWPGALVGWLMAGD